jgi:hypothetical protein
VESDGQTPWEGAQVATLEVLLEICQDFGDELVNGPAGSFVSQVGTEPLEMREAMLGYSSSPAMSAMLAVLVDGLASRRGWWSGNGSSWGTGTGEFSWPAGPARLPTP